MQQLPFIKMHGAENDYIFFDGFSSTLPQNPERLAPVICHRYAGIGGDGIITMAPPSRASYDVEMQIWNANGSSATMCGNGARCIAVWMKHTGRVTDVCRIKTASRIVTARDIYSDGSSGIATVEMGLPQLLSPADGDTIKLAEGSWVTVHRIEIGNRHAVLFMDDVNNIEVDKLGSAIERHYAGNGGTNVEFVQQLNGDTFLARVWERGSGETQACGSGACAIAAAAVHAGRLPSGQQCVIRMPGGELHTDSTTDSDILLTGPVRIVCIGCVTVPVSGE